MTNSANSSPASKQDRLARIHFGDGDYAILAQGDHVLCAVTGVKIPLAELRYWSVERQEAYVDAAASLKAVETARH